jgi:hypothetical protein
MNGVTKGGKGFPLFVIDYGVGINEDGVRNGGCEVGLKQVVMKYLLS